MPLDMPDVFRISVYGDVLFAVAILAATLIAARIFYPVFKKIVHHLTKKTETTIDDEVVEALEKPIYLAVFIIGLYYAIVAIDYLLPYVDIIRNIFIIFGIVLGGYTTNRIVNVILSWYKENLAIKTHTKVDDKLMPVFSKIFRYIIFFSVIILILHQLGFEITPLLAGLGIGGLAVALALQPTLSNFFAGTYIATEGAIKVGDYIELDNKMAGFVEEIGSRSTKIKTLPNNIILIPNSRLAESIVTNYSEPNAELAVVVPVGVSYSSNLEKVEKVTIDTAKKTMKETEGAVKDLEHVIRYNEFGDSNKNFVVLLRAKAFVDQHLLKHEFIKALKKRYDKEGIEISYPVTNVYMRKEKKRN